jgi:hypothetical protein
MNRRTFVSLLIVALAGTALARAEQAKPKPAAKSPMTFSGEITAVDAQARTFTARGPEASAREMKFRVEAGAKVMVNGHPKSINDLTRGEHVRVTYTGTGDLLTATAVTVEQPKKKG